MTDLGLEWSKGPDLLLGRVEHRSIIIGNVIYHVGGSGNMLVLLLWLTHWFRCVQKCTFLLFRSKFRYTPESSEFYSRRNQWVKLFLTLFRKTEKWTIKENEITKELLNLELSGYNIYPELFAVKQNYCTFLWTSINSCKKNLKNRNEFLYSYFKNLNIAEKKKEQWWYDRETSIAKIGFASWPTHRDVSFSQSCLKISSK